MWTSSFRGRLLITSGSFSKGVFCNYPDLERRAALEKIHTLQQPSPQSTTSTGSSTSAGPISTEPAPPLNAFPPVFYLDWNVFQQCQVEIPKPTLPIPQNVSKIIGGAENWDLIASEFFTAAHTWIPIISKKRFYESMQPPLASSVWIMPF